MATFETLLDLNPWAEAHAPDFAGPAFERARRRAASARLARRDGLGFDGWARAMTALRARLPVAAAPAWAALAATAFDDTAPAAGIGDAWDLGGGAYPGALILGPARIAGDLRIDGAEIGGDLVIDGVAVGGALSMQRAQVCGALTLRRLDAGARSDFSGVRVAGPAALEGCRFAVDAWFRDAAFEAGLTIAESRFGGDAGFHFSQIDGETRLRAVAFDDGFGVESARFGGPVVLADVTVAGRLWTRGAVFARDADRLAVAALTPTPPSTARAPDASDRDAPGGAGARRRGA